MAETSREYLVGTVRPTSRPEAGQEVDCDTLIPAKIKFVSNSMNFTARKTSFAPRSLDTKRKPRSWLGWAPI
jgi:hypothetical protein